ncbi:hypothetical protein B0H13DRAFT_1870060 [Mycena leptocephala]|nr:hypothetical protein B0H13DRAFT_1870060 [Mycena leptocephala]
MTVNTNLHSELPQSKEIIIISLNDETGGVHTRRTSGGEYFRASFRVIPGRQIKAPNGYDRRGSAVKIESVHKPTTTNQRRRIVANKTDSTAEQTPDENRLRLEQNLKAKAQQICCFNYLKESRKSEHEIWTHHEERANMIEWAGLPHSTEMRGSEIQLLRAIESSAARVHERASKEGAANSSAQGEMRTAHNADLESRCGRNAQRAWQSWGANGVEAARIVAGGRAGEKWGVWDGVWPRTSSRGCDGAMLVLWGRRRTEHKWRMGAVGAEY